MLNELKEKIIELVPEIVELKFGCEVKTHFDGILTLTHRHVIGNVKECWGATTGRVGTLCNDEDIKEVLGRPITLADVLMAMELKQKRPYWIGAHGEWICFDESDEVISIAESKSWNLSKPLDEQSEETIAFLHSVICK